jgi:hypothetical protein
MGKKNRLAIFGFKKTELLKAEPVVSVTAGVYAKFKNNCTII